MSRFEGYGTSYLAPALIQCMGETVSYTPSGGAASSITAVVNRETLQSQDIDGIRTQYMLDILVSKSDVATVTTGADTVALKRRVGDANNTTFKVTEIMSQDGGMWWLRLN